MNTSRSPMGSWLDPASDRLKAQVASRKVVDERQADALWRMGPSVDLARCAGGVAILAEE